MVLLGWEDDGGRRGVVVKTHDYCLFSSSMEGVSI